MNALKILFFLLLLVSNGTAASTAIIGNEDSCDDLWYELPVYQTPRSRSSAADRAFLQFFPPKAYSVSFEDQKSFVEGESNILSLRLEGVLNCLRAHRLTLETVINQQKKASSLSKVLDASRAADVKKMIVEKQEDTQEKGYERSRALCQYEKLDGTIKLLYSEFYSGPNDCSGIRFSQTIKSWLTPDKIEKKFNLLREEISGMVVLVKKTGIPEKLPKVVCFEFQ